MALESTERDDAFDWTAIKFLAFPMLSLLVLVEVALGGNFLWLVFPTYIAVALAGDEAFGDDFAMGSRARAMLLDAYLFAALPLALAVTALFAMHAGGAPAWAVSIAGSVGFDLDARIARTDGWDIAAGVFGLGTFYGTLVNVAHELIHRTGDRAAWLTGRWLLAHTFDTGFAIEHVHGHHRHVGTARDPATARRGEYVLGFAWRSTVGRRPRPARPRPARPGPGQAPWACRGRDAPAGRTGSWRPSARRARSRRSP